MIHQKYGQSKCNIKKKEIAYIIEMISFPKLLLCVVDLQNVNMKQYFLKCENLL